MKRRSPGLLVILYLFLPIKNLPSAQIILCHIKAIYAARQAEKKLYLDLDTDLDLEDNIDKVVRELLISLWFDPGNAVACAYINLLAPHLGLFDYDLMEIRRKIANQKFEFSNHAVDRSIVDRIQVNEIEEIIANGQIVKEYSNSKYHSGYLIYGLTQSQRSIQVKCGHFNRPLIHIIDVSEMETEENENSTTKATKNNDRNSIEILVNSRAIYVASVNDRMFSIENVPVRINEETKEHLFCSSTVKNLQYIINSKTLPSVEIESFVYDYNEYNFE